MESLEARVKKIIVEQLSVEEDAVKSEAKFVDDLGADSLDIVELVMAFEEEFGVEILRVRELQSWTAPMPVPQAPQDGADVSALVRDPRRAATAGLKLERVLALHRRSDGVQPAPVVAAAGRLDPELLARALQAIERAPEVLAGRVRGRLVVDVNA